MQIPGYKIIDTLGEGGMARVYLAIQESFEREVALKVLDPHLSRDPSFGERFLHEARIVSRLVHPNIVTVYDVGVHRGNHFLSMEYVPGRDLKHRRFELSLPESIAVIKDVARALDYAGRKGCVHRDVKPDNIMLHAEDGRAVLMDFGIARIVDQASTMTQTGTTVGTPHYMSPEHARGAPVDSRADLYSLGVVLFLLLTGYLPYDSDSAVSIGVMHISDSIPRLPEHLAAFQPLIDRVLAKNPDDRFQTGGELVEALEAFDRDALNLMERAGERLLVQEADGESPTLHQPQAVMAEPLGDIDVEIGVGRGMADDYLAVHDDDRIEWETNPGQARSGGWGWMLLVVSLVVVVVGAFYWQEPLRAQWEQQVVPLLASPEAEPDTGTPGIVVPDETEAEPLLPELSQPLADAPSAVPDLAEREGEPSQTPEPSAEPQSVPDSGTNGPPDVTPSASNGADGELSLAEEPPVATGTDEPAAAPEATQSARDERIQVISQAAADRAGQGDIDGALQQLERGINEFPDSEKLVLQRERLTAQRQEEAERQAQAAREARLQTQIDTIESQLAEGDLERAGEQLRQARTEFPDSSALLSLEIEWSEQRDAAQRPVIEQARVSTQPLESLVGGQSATLVPTRVLHAGFAYRNFGETSSVIQAILYDGSRQLQIALVPVIIQDDTGEAFFRLERPVTGFVEGGYHLDLVSEGEALASISFQVES